MLGPFAPRDPSSVLCLGCPGYGWCVGENWKKGVKHPVPVSPLNLPLALPQEEAGRQGPLVPGLGLFKVSLATREPPQHPSAWARGESYWERKRKRVPSQDVTAPQSREKEGRALLCATLLPLPWWRNEALRGNACSPYCLWGGSQIHPLYFQSPPDAVAFPRLALGLPRHH